MSECKSNHGARGVNALHHTLLHASIPSNPPAVSNYTNTVTSLMMMGMKVDMIMMTCHIQDIGPDGSTAEACGLLDSASPASFISECLAQTLRLQRSSRSATNLWYCRSIT